MSARPESGMPYFDRTLGIFTVKTLHEREGDYYTYGGFGDYLSAMRSSFAEVVLFAHVRRAAPGPGFYPIPRGNLRVVELPFVRGEGQALRAIPRVWAIARRELDGIDVVHARMPDYTGVVGALLARRRGIPCFIQVIADWALQSRSVPWNKCGGLGTFLKLHMLLYDRVERLVCRGQLVFAQGASAYEKHRRTANAQLVVSSAHHVSDISPVRPRFGGAPYRILNVARLTSEKNQQLLVRALAELRSRGQDWRLQLVGQGPHEESIRALSRTLGVSDFVDLAGMVAHGADLWDYFDRADVFVLSSRSEGTPKVLLEAMARGVPVVAAAVGGVPTLVEDGRNGLLFEDDSLEDLLSKLERVSADHRLSARLATEASVTARRHTVEEESLRMLQLVQRELFGETMAASAATEEHGHTADGAPARSHRAGVETV